MKVLVLSYHRVYPGYHINPETFEWQMKTLKEKFTPLALDEAVAFARGDLTLKKDGFAITFDDGWADNFIYAYPILKKYQIPATIFVPTNFISNTNSARRSFKESGSDEAAAEVAEKGRSEQFLTWEEIRAMSPLIKIESHGHAHAYHFRSPKVMDVFGQIPRGRQNWLLLSGVKAIPGAPIYESGSALAYPRYYENEKHLESFDEYKNRIRKELEISIAKIVEKTGYRPKYLAWPFGEHSKTAIDAAKKVGFEACFTANQGSVSPDADPYKLSRFSPPRGRRLFITALKGEIGLLTYRTLLAGLSLLKKFRPSLNSQAGFFSQIKA